MNFTDCFAFHLSTCAKYMCPLCARRSYHPWCHLPVQLEPHRPSSPYEYFRNDTKSTLIKPPLSLGEERNKTQKPHLFSLWTIITSSQLLASTNQPVVGNMVTICPFVPDKKGLCRISRCHCELDLLN